MSWLLAATLRRATASQPGWRSGQNDRVTAGGIAGENRSSAVKQAMSNAPPDSCEESESTQLAAAAYDGPLKPPSVQITGYS
jgi:hypothetical protein